MKAFINKGYTEVNIDNRDIFRMVNVIIKKLSFYTRDTSDITKEIKRIIVELLFSAELVLIKESKEISYQEEEDIKYQLYKYYNEYT